MKTAHRQASTAKRRRWAADPGALWRTVGRQQEFTPAERCTLNLPVRIAFERTRTGTAIDGDFDTMAVAVNVAMVCAESIDPFVEHTCILARDALMRMHERHARTHVWGFDGPGMHEVLATIDLYEQLTHLLNAGQLEDALKECVRRMRTGDYMGAPA